MKQTESLYFNFMEKTMAEMTSLLNKASAAADEARRAPDMDGYTKKIQESNLYISQIDGLITARNIFKETFYSAGY